VALGGSATSRPRLPAGSQAYKASAAAFAMKSAPISTRLTLAAAALTYSSGSDATLSPGAGHGTTEATMTEVTITERAARRIGEILKTEPAGAMLRLSVMGGGCSGFQYKFDVESTKTEDDAAIVRDGVTMLVDSMSLQYLAGSEVDFVEDLIGASFKVNNPQAKASCGCGTSFSL
jgi:iron-sulfur cluster assembly accessory protein